MKLILALSALTMAGCTSHQASQNTTRFSESHFNYKWSKAGASKTDLRADEIGCETSAQDRQAMSVQAMNQYKYARMHMGVAGFGLEEPAEIDEYAMASMVQRCIEAHGWRLVSMDPIKLSPHEDDDDVRDRHAFMEQ